MKKKPSAVPYLPPTHQSVLLDETVGGLSLKTGDTAVDATVGTGGHAEKIAGIVGRAGVLLLVDVDADSIVRSKERLRSAPAKLIFVQGNFRNLKTLAASAGVREADGIAFDLGWHAEQLAAGKGLSFKSDDPLVMTLGERSATLTAKDIIADWDESAIVEMLRAYGEERFSGRIARAIVEARKKQTIETAAQLAEVVARSVPALYRKGRLHPATRTFQALRIAVNDELEALKEALADALDLLAPGGRIAVISFHSLEDRIVKRAFRAAEESGAGRRVTKKPIVPGATERAANPRARSAKLRIFEKKS